MNFYIIYITSKSVFLGGVDGGGGQVLSILDIHNIIYNKLRPLVIMASSHDFWNGLLLLISTPIQKQLQKMQLHSFESVALQCFKQPNQLSRFSKKSF